MESKETIEFDQFTALDLRAATILIAEPHPNADRLVKLQIDLGDHRRQICAGIRQHIEDLSALEGMQIIVVANLAPRTIRGEESNGMLLAATAMSDGAVSDVVLLTPVRPVPPGSAVG